MRMPARPGRSRALAIAASVLISGAALAAVTAPAQAATAKPAIAPETVTVVNPGATTEPLETAITLPLTATDSDVADYPLIWSASANLPLGLSIDATNTDGTDAAITGTVTAAEAGTYKITVTATDSALPVGVPGSATFALTLANTVTVTSPGNQSAVTGTAITPLPIAAADTDTAATLAYTAENLPTGLTINPTTGVIS